MDSREFAKSLEKQVTDFCQNLDAKLPAYTGDTLLGGALAYAVGAWLLWRLTVRRMRWVVGKL